ncbi:PDR/VanB family oxidoreductase [Microbacterium sp. NPDC008134]|uniref:PDR/VanB family oxidoreductase n=1 Tax=Microbacterium sp. NPDC008134 TaxID=3364183 RepID=UPI0036E77D37
MRSREGLLPLVVTEIVRETPTIVSLRLAAPDGSPLPPWQPGAHVDVQLITRHERQYSLCGDPADVTGYRIAVLREPASRGGSHYIHSFLRVGSRVWVRPPRNLFTLADAPAYHLLAAGIGITPILAMARHLAAEGADWRMTYLVRNRDDVAFDEELAAFGDRVDLHVSAESGRLDLAELCAGLAPGTAVYACGPQGFVDALDAQADVLPDGASIHVERFEPKPREFRPNEPFTVVCSRSEVTVEVPADRSMIVSLQRAGVPMEGSCLRGICGSCAVSVLDGTPEHRDSLTADDASMTIYPCVSRALSPMLVIDA